MNQIPLETLKITTHSGEGFYSIDEEVNQKLSILIKKIPKTANIFNSGTLFLYNMHTSCALVVNESYDPTAKEDMENFMKHLAPRNLKFIKHTLEGPDDSPSHMKSILLNQHLSFPVENGKILKGTWQGIYLAEFRDQPKLRNVVIKYVPDLKF